MFTRSQERAREEGGFTLIELLVVILIIGILASVALPAFLRQREKGQDSAAKSNARNVASQLESCFTQKESFTGCDAALVADPGGLPIVAGTPAPGQVTIRIRASGNEYEIAAKSKARTSSANHMFYYDFKWLTNDRSLSCTPMNKGGCGDLHPEIPGEGIW